MKSASKRIKMIDIAKEAGVSITTRYNQKLWIGVAKEHILL